MRQRNHCSSLKGIPKMKLQDSGPSGPKSLQSQNRPRPENRLSISRLDVVHGQLVGLEACATAHYWGRELRALGHEVRLMPAQYVKAYIKRNKHDAADAEAICEAVGRPTMRFVPVKTADQQAAVLLHRGRERLVRQRTGLVNALRGHLAEFGVIAPQGLRNVGKLIAIVRDEGDARLPD